MVIVPVRVGNDLIAPTAPIEAEVEFDEAEVEFDEKDSLYTAAIPSLGINTFAETRDGLSDAIEGELSLLWKHYVEVDDGQLTPAAHALKRRMQATFRKFPGPDRLSADQGRVR